MNKLLTFSFLILICCTKKDKPTTIADSTKTQKPVTGSVEHPKLYVNYMRDTLRLGLSAWEVDSVVVVNTEYFRIPLSKEKSGYLAMSDSSRELTEEWSVRFLTYVVANYPTYSGPADFNTPQEFLNYMSERGYEKFAQSKGDKEIIYTFKKRSGNNLHEEFEQAQDDTRYLIVRAYLVYADGSLSSFNILGNSEESRGLYNTIIGEGSARKPSSKTKVIITSNAADLSIEITNGDQVVYSKRGVDIDGDYEILIDNTGCGPVVISVKKNGTSFYDGKIDFICNGE